MNFVSSAFILFLLVVLGLSWAVPPRYKRFILLPASWFFYAWHSIPLLGLLIAATAVSYLCALGMDRHSERRKKLPFMLLGCIFLLGMLFIFKYLDFTVSGLAFLLGREPHRFNLILPVGISFYVFQTLSYLADVYLGKIRAERDIVLYALFVSFFPQLVAGPIERPADLIPQLACPSKPDSDGKRDALRLLIGGYAKKVIIADSIAPLVDAAYSNPAAAGGAALAAATVLFAIQIYCDFAGYSEIAAGCAGLMGIKLSQNFNRPYSAVTVRDFWRRWHISLSRWFSDYVYIPLGGSRRGRVRTCINILIVFMLSGLWHGADITFVVWGLLHGLYLAAENIFDRRLEPRYPLLRRLLTLFLVCFAWIFFRAESWSSALSVIHSVLFEFSPEKLLQGLGVSLPEMLTYLGIIMTLPLLERLPKLREGCGYRSSLCFLLVILLMLLCRAFVLSQGGSPAFIYFRF